MSIRNLLTSSLLILLLAAAGCSDDDCATCPGDDSADLEPTIANVWPNADGNVWIYDNATAAFEGDPDEQSDPDDPLPELPSMETLHARLVEPVPFAPLGSSDGLYRMAFDGDVTTHSDVTAQNLTEELFNPAAGMRLLPNREERLRELILTLRPDLRPKGEPKPRDKAAGDELEVPLLMGGYAFDATEAGLYSYGDISTNHSWIYLESDLSVGHEFTMQLVPELADDIFLYGRIWSVGELAIGERTYENCVECFYLIDMGVQVATDENGVVLYWGRAYLYGSVYYSPGVGPIRCHQRAHLVPDPILQDGEGGILEIVAEISGFEVGAP